MRAKLDENLPTDLARLARERGHEVMTVREEHMAGCDDQALFDTCIAERRILFTLDLDFGNPLRFPPTRTAGIVVLRPHRPLLTLIKALFLIALDKMAAEGLQGKLWIVEPTAIRVYDDRE